MRRSPPPIPGVGSCSRVSPPVLRGLSRLKFSSPLCGQAACNACMQCPGPSFPSLPPVQLTFPLSLPVQKIGEAFSPPLPLLPVELFLWLPTPRSSFKTSVSISLHLWFYSQLPTPKSKIKNQKSKIPLQFHLLPHYFTFSCVSPCNTTFQPHFFSAKSRPLQSSVCPRRKGRVGQCHSEQSQRQLEGWSFRALLFGNARRNGIACGVVWKKEISAGR